MKKYFVALACIIATAFTVAVVEWNIVPESKVNFKINGPAGIDVKGVFTISSSSIHFDGAELDKSAIQASVAAASINTGNEKRDKHLRSDDFFDAEKFPHIKFASTSIEKSGDDKFIAKGNLTIKETTKPIEIPFSFSHTGSEGSFVGSFTIKRRDYGVGGKSMMMGNEVVITLDIPVKK